MSGPLLDRIDLHIEVPAVRLQDLRERGAEETATVAARVARARQVQAERFGPDHPSPCNAALEPDEMRRHCPLAASGQALLDQAFQRLGLSVRALSRILKVARTIADLAGAERIETAHLAEAIQYRALDRRVTA